MNLKYPMVDFQLRDIPFSVILWMEEILHQLVDGLSHDYPIIYSVLYLPIVTNWCRISSIHSTSRFSHPAFDSCSPSRLRLTDVVRCRGKVHAAYLLLRPAAADPWETAAGWGYSHSHGLYNGYIMVIISP